MRGDEVEQLAVKAAHRRFVGFAQLHRPLDHRLEDRRQIARGAVDDLQNVRSRSLLLQCLARLGQQPRVFDRDDSLHREILQQRDLLVGERPDFLAIDRQTAEQSIFLKQRHNEKGTRAAELDRSDAQPVARPVGVGGPDIGNVDEAFPAQNAAESRLRAGLQRLAREIRVRARHAAHCNCV